jgi:hypothetical protein
MKLVRFCQNPPKNPSKSSTVSNVSAFFTSKIYHTPTTHRLALFWGKVKGPKLDDYVASWSGHHVLLIKDYVFWLMLGHGFERSLIS